jgi:hypothetical protein
MLSWIIWSSSCSSLPNNSPPTLSRRKLDISAKIPGLEYYWQECTKKFLGSCRKWETKIEYYDLTDPAVRQKLIDMGFVAKVRENWLP